MIPIQILTSPQSLNDLNLYRGNPYDSMIKYVIDIEKKMIALGGEMHADAEQVLLENGSLQEHLWGANIYPWNDPPEIEYTSLINLRPSSGNRSMEIQDENIRIKIQTITWEWILIQ